MVKALEKKEPGYLNDFLEYTESQHTTHIVLWYEQKLDV